MAGNALKEKWAAGEPSYGVWCAIPSSYVAEVCAHQGFDYVCVDLQHGMIDYPVATDMILAIHAGGSVPIVRVPSNELGAINRVLDAGAMGIIVPLIESVADVEAARAVATHDEQREPPSHLGAIGDPRSVGRPGDRTDLRLARKRERDRGGFVDGLKFDFFHLGCFFTFGWRWNLFNH